MRNHYQLDLEADEERERADRRLHAAISKLRSPQEMNAFIKRARESTLSDKMKKRVVKWLQERVDIWKGQGNGKE